MQFLIALVCGGTLPAGCLGELRPPAYAFSVTEPMAPAQHLHTAYRGNKAFYIDGYWYQRAPGGWIYYLREPHVLYEYRRSATARERRRAQYSQKRADEAN